MSGKKIVTVAVVVVILAVAIALVSRQWTVRQVYFKYTKKIAYKMNPEQKAKYLEEFDYTVKKFWKLYGKGVMTRNDLNDVVWKMKRLAGKSELKNREIFDFIGYVSRLYTDALDRLHREQLRKKES